MAKNPKLTKDILSTVLNMVREKLSTTVLWYLLVSVSHLAANKGRFAAAFEESRFSERMSDFHEFYS